MPTPKFDIDEYSKRLIKVKETNRLAIPKDSTIEGNFKMLNKIQKEVDIFNLDQVKEYFVKMKYSKKTIINYLSIILHLITYESYDDPEYKSKYQEFKKYFDDVNSDQDKMIESKKASTEQKQKSQDTTKEEVMELIQKLNKLGMTKDALILELLLDNPCRLEVGTLKYLKYNNFLKIEPDNQQNYLVLKINKDSEPTILISRASYKTSDKYGRATFELENEKLTEKIANYIIINKLHEGSEVFGYTPPQLAKRLHYLTKKYNDGITLSTNAICKIHTTSEVKNVSPTIIEDMEQVESKLKKISTKRGTSTEVLKKSYLKK